jgi:hypothetical protein
MRSVKLTDGATIEVRPIGWRAWRSLREEFAAVLRSDQLGELVDGIVSLMASETAAEPTGEVAADLLLDEASDDTDAEPASRLANIDWMAVMPKLVEGLATGAGLVTTLLGDITEQVVLRALLAAEGNFFAGLFEIANRQPRDAK